MLDLPIQDTDLFNAFRPRLKGLAYKMLGSIADAEDVLQDAFIRWLQADRSLVREPEAYLRQVVTRLCLDELKSARARREAYVGSWLPEPLLQEEPSEDIILPLLLVLERLSPSERAAFLLHDVFGVAFDEIALTIGRDAAACRQMARRARLRIRAERPRLPPQGTRGQEIAAAFFTASRTGDIDGLRALLARDVMIQADGGGKVAAPPHPIMGIEAALKLMAALARLFSAQMSQLLRYASVNGLPGFVTLERGCELQTTALDVRGDRIAAVYVCRNPEKLGHLVIDRTAANQIRPASKGTRQ
ncbi:RNA polymerase sigma factor SigJ [Labrys sp. ZIDIC5]|uniref:RNA polymerase sigma factor SigJ n=1 Tax=Labrys sedimenti TaxID=3106036 RepID=UPI002ACA5A44|nr:RNA polymerase sigma factor SigJ [Labrys sp. ZIDIC5]MDZ5452994.1 RNA polymerase sigma factor SigJ [Labrys sp. ZIDIC5]